MSILNGSNYQVWKNQMKAWLQSKGLWQIMSKDEWKFPEADASATVTIHKANYKSWMEWDNKDNQAYGLILLQVNPSVAVVTSSTATTNATWLALHTAFSQTGPSTIFNKFKNAIYKKISTANPALDIMEMNEKFQCLMAAQVDIPEVVQAMILLNVIPKEYDGVAQMTLQTMEQSKLTFNYIWDAILMENSQLKVGQPVK